MRKIENLLKGGDLRSIGQSNQVVSFVDSQAGFDELFQQLYHADRIVVMRSADAIEKIIRKNAGFLKKHKAEILQLCEAATHIELKWHLALIVTRLDLTKKEFGKVWQTLTGWAIDKNESKIVRVNALQGLFDLQRINQELKEDFNLIIRQVEKEHISSIHARIKKIKNSSNKKNVGGTRSLK
jgi:hypothetical protein